MVAQISGTRDGVDWPDAGGEIDLPKDEAEQLIAARLAQPIVKGGAKLETATAPKAETATRKGLTKADL